MSAGPTPAKHALAHAFQHAIFLEMRGKVGEAEQLYRFILACDQNHFGALRGLGLVRMQNGEFALAEALLRQALRQEPRSHEATLDLAGAMLNMERYDEAIRYAEAAIAIKPDFAGAYGILGAAFRITGRLEEARRAFEQAVEHVPTNGRFHRELAECKRHVKSDPNLALMEQLASRSAMLPEEAQHELHFALGKAYSDLGRHESSFRHLLEANTLRRRRFDYDEAGTLAKFDRIRAVFTHDVIRRFRHCGHPSSRPIFILGMPRSGTTLVERILASHPKVFGAGEVMTLDETVERVCGATDVQATYPETVSRILRERMLELGTCYIDRMRALAPTAQRITDKVPSNFLYIGLIHVALPNARIIHVERDPVDTCMSCFSRPFSSSQAFTTDLGELGRYYRAYARLMAHWRNLLPRDAILDVQYENLVAHPEQEARRIINYCDLDWNDHCLTPHKAPGPVRTASAIQVRRPIYRTSVGRSRPYRRFLGPLLEALCAE